jgi:putative hydrolase of the HAD superfamily
MQPRKHLTTIGFDADDTLWQNEQFFRLTEKRFAALLADHGEVEHISARLLEAEKRNLAVYGFGIKGFTLSMIETAIEVTEGRVPAATIAEILAAGRDMLGHPVEALPHARETVERLAGAYHLVLITKGDLFDQERKLAASGLGAAPANSRLRTCPRRSPPSASMPTTRCGRTSGSSGEIG